MNVDRGGMGCAAVVALVVVVVVGVAIYGGITDSEITCDDYKDPEACQRQERGQQRPDRRSQGSNRQLNLIKLCNEAQTAEDERAIAEDYGYYCH